MQTRCFLLVIQYCLLWWNYCWCVEYHSCESTWGKLYWSFVGSNTVSFVLICSLNKVLFFYTSEGFQVRTLRSLTNLDNIWTCAKRRQCSVGQLLQLNCVSREKQKLGIRIFTEKPHVSVTNSIFDISCLLLPMKTFHDGVCNATEQIAISSIVNNPVPVFT